MNKLVEHILEIITQLKFENRSKTTRPRFLKSFALRGDSAAPEDEKHWIIYKTTRGDLAAPEDEMNYIALHKKLHCIQTFLADKKHL